MGRRAAPSRPLERTPPHLVYRVEAKTHTALSKYPLVPRYFPAQVSALSLVATEKFAPLAEGGGSVMLSHMRWDQKILLWWTRCLCLGAILVAGHGMLNPAYAGFMPPDFDTVSHGETREISSSYADRTESNAPTSHWVIEWNFSASDSSEAGSTSSQNNVVQAVGIDGQRRPWPLPIRQFSGFSRERVQIALGFSIDVMRPPKG